MKKTIYTMEAGDAVKGTYFDHAFEGVIEQIRPNYANHNKTVIFITLDFPIAVNGGQDWRSSICLEIYKDPNHEWNKEAGCYIQFKLTPEEEAQKVAHEAADRKLSEDIQVYWTEANWMIAEYGYESAMKSLFNSISAYAGNEYKHAIALAVYYAFNGAKG